MVREIDRDGHVKKVELAQKVKAFMDSEMWTEVFSPVLESYKKGLLDASTIDVSSDKTAAIEVKARTLAAQYVEKIEVLLNGIIADGEMSQRILTPPEDKLPLTKKVPVDN
jgi:hypothetical protein